MGLYNEICLYNKIGLFDEMCIYGKMRVYSEVSRLRVCVLAHSIEMYVNSV